LFLLGLFIGNTFQYQLNSTTLVGIGISSISSVTGVLKMLFDWKNEPTLEFGELTHNDEPAYFINVKKKKGKGYAKDCEGKIKTDGINTHTVWALNEPRRIDIADEMKLRLFAVDTKENTIDFPSATFTEGRSFNFKDLDDYLNKDLTIMVYCNTNSPKPYIKKIRDIIDNSTSD
jgi:hypothetical protein